MRHQLFVIIRIHQGNPTPSSEDIQVTERLVQAVNIIGVDVLDHIVLGDKLLCVTKRKSLFLKGAM
ncbi:JAB domain-containing protein [Bacillus paranthracis]|uniref:JAB domain-containing protein n=1 Tax=Bacillus paranthracis TaxID=2026186 RepID=UPI003EE04B49